MRSQKSAGEDVAVGEFNRTTEGVTRRNHEVTSILPLSYLPLYNLLVQLLLLFFLLAL